jgi:hypothetical protein
MTVMDDNRHRVTLRQAKPGERFDVAIVEPDTVGLFVGSEFPDADSV